MKSIVKASTSTEIESDRFQAGLVSRFSAPGSETGDCNEDALGVWDLEFGIVLAVADGMGGGPGGAAAAAKAIDGLDQSLSHARTPNDLRPAILDAFESSNALILEPGIGAGTTLAVLEIVGRTARAYHAGDSGILAVGQRGAIRFQSKLHSPTGFAVASGLLEQDDVHAHPERHLLSNHVGSHEMHIDVGPPFALLPRDTILLASDGVLDNIRNEVLVDTIRKGALDQAAASLLDQARAAMNNEVDGLPAHPDDATAILFRHGLSAQTTRRKRK